MHVRTSDLLYCLRRVREVNEHYRLTNLGGDEYPRDIDRLHATSQAILATSITLFPLGLAENSVVLGFCLELAEGQGYDIGYADGLSAELTRVVVAKEIFHAVIKRDEYRSMNILGHIEALTAAFPDDNSKPAASIQIELVAEIAAMEFLFPLAKREEELLQMRDPAEIAAQYGVPRFLVEKYLSDNFMDGLRRAAKSLEELTPKV